MYGKPRVLSILLCAGADPQARTLFAQSPLDIALQNQSAGCQECVHVLVAHGVRLSSARALARDSIQPAAVALEEGRLRCRAAAIVLLGLKRRRGVVLCRHDRFVVRELCVCIYATRTDKAWQPPTPEPPQATHAPAPQSVCTIQ